MTNYVNKVEQIINDSRLNFVGNKFSLKGLSKLKLYRKSNNNGMLLRIDKAVEVKEHLSVFYVWFKNLRNDFLGVLKDVLEAMIFDKK